MLPIYELHSTAALSGILSVYEDVIIMDTILIMDTIVIRPSQNGYVMISSADGDQPQHRPLKLKHK